DAVIEVMRHKGPEMAEGNRHVSGLAIGVEDAADRQWLRRSWYAEEVRSFVNRSLLLLIIQAAGLWALSLLLTGTKWEVPTGETMRQGLVFGALGLGLLFAWPILLVALLRVSGWPSLLRPTALAVLAATTGRGLVVLIGHFLAQKSAGSGTGNSLGLLLDPFTWVFIIFGVVVTVHAFRLAGDARFILP